MPKLHLELNCLHDALQEVSHDDPLFLCATLKASVVGNDLSLSSSASAALHAMFKDTKESIKLLKICLSKLGCGVPPPASGSAGPSSSTSEGCPGMAGGG